MAKNSTIHYVPRPVCSTAGQQQFTLQAFKHGSYEIKVYRSKHDQQRYQHAGVDTRSTEPGY
jgi:hypothetical protein